jgi:hypothetical protein
MLLELLSHPSVRLNPQRKPLENAEGRQAAHEGGSGDRDGEGSEEEEESRGPAGVVRGLGE